LVASLVQSNPGMSAMGAPRDIKVNGMAAKSVELQGGSPIQGQRERDWLVTMASGNGSILSLVFVAPERDNTRLRPTYEQMLRTLRLQSGQNLR
jgi:hypothetical protein